MKFTGPSYRAHHPAWAFAPTSGDGAAIRGARFNARGVPTLYLATSLEGAIVEATQGFGHKIEPLTICAYDIDCSDIVDLSTPEACAAVDVSPEECACAWALDLAEGREPASWRVASRFRASGAAGLLVPSYARGARPHFRNLVLWRWGTDLPTRVTVHDPNHRLPRDGSSWRSPHS